MKQGRKLVEQYKKHIKEHLHLGPYFNTWVIWTADRIALDPDITSSQRGQKLQAFFTAKRELENEVN